MDTAPNTIQAKARRLMEHLKRDIAWTARGELIHEGVPVVGSYVVDLVNDLLRKRNTDPTGWQPFARQFRAITFPWSWSVTSPGEPTYVRRKRPLLLVERPQQQHLLQLLVPLLLMHDDHSVGHPSLVRWNIPCSSRHRNDNARLLLHWLIGKTFKAVRYVSIAQCALRCAIHRTRTVPSSLRYFAVDFTCSPTLSPDV